MRAIANKSLLFALLLGLALPRTSAAPDEEAYGRAEGYPSGSRWTFLEQKHLVGSLSAMDAIFRARTIKAKGKLRPLPALEARDEWPEVDRYLAEQPVTGLLVIKDGKVLVEKYQYGRTAEHRFASWSMAKTVLAMAVGIAVSEGLIASIDDPLDKYEPELGASAWRGVSIRHALHMASGVKFDEAYDTSDSDVIRLSRAWARNTGELLSVLKTITQRDAEPGTRFHYSSADTQALAQTLRGAIGRPLADYVSEKIWTPMGAEADASWLIDSTGMEAAYCCLNARLRDYGRLAMLLLDRGTFAGRSIIPPEWVDAATSVGSSDVYLQPGTASSYYGYGYQTWIFPEHHGYALLGVRGQSIFVHPRLRLIMVQTAVNVRSSDPSLNRRRNQFWRELVARAERM